MEELELEVMGPLQVVWLERLEAERGNLRAALDWHLDEVAESGERAEMGLRLAAALSSSCLGLVVVIIALACSPTMSFFPCYLPAVGF